MDQPNKCENVNYLVCRRFEEVVTLTKAARYIVVAAGLCGANTIGPTSPQLANQVLLLPLSIDLESITRAFFYSECQACL